MLTSNFAHRLRTNCAPILGLMFLSTPAWTVQSGSPPPCEHGWLRALGGRPGVDGVVESLGVFDDGSGPSLAVGGVFTKAGGGLATNVARWDGADWRAMGALDGSVQALCEFDPGTGPTLHAGGWFTHAGGQPVNFVARWDGQEWVSMGGGLNGVVLTLTVHDEGGGPALYAGGLFSHAGGAPASNVARWDGTGWQALGGGVDNVVHALISHDDGNGPALYAGGTFLSAGGVPAQGIARWRSGTWSAVGGGVSGHVRALEVLDAGSGPQLYAGGNFTQAGGLPASRMARWDGSAWSALGAGLQGHVWTLAVHDDGNGARLYAGGNFTQSGVWFPGVALWSGSAWSFVQTGILPGLPNTLLSYDDGNGPALVMGGDFWHLDWVTVRSLAQLRGGTWSGLGRGPDGLVKHVGSCDLGGGPELYLSGIFKFVDGLPLHRFVRWNGVAWQEIGHAVEARDMLVFDDGSGPSVFVTGFGILIPPATAGQSIGRYDGVTMHSLAGGLNNPGNTLAVYDDGSGTALFVGGNFTQAGGNPASKIARWNGTGWTALGAGIQIEGTVSKLLVHDDGSGPALFAGGSFWAIAGVPIQRTARWDGTAWQPLGSGLLGGTVFTQEVEMAVFDDGGGPQLYVTGDFFSAGGVPANHIARWDGSSWHALGAGLDGRGITLCVFDDGSGPALYVGGDFQHAGGIPANRIARWNGSSWSALGRGLGLDSSFLQQWPNTMAVHEFVPGEGASLVVGGSIDGVPDSGDSYLARWGCIGGAPIGVPFCHGDGSASPCPCANFGAAGEGCANSAGQGARLGAVGSASVSSADLVLEAHGVPPLRPGLFFQGTTRVNGGQGAPFGDGLRCAGGAQARLEVSVAGLDGRAATSVTVAAQGSVVPGEARTYQFWYRDPIGPCGMGFNFTQGLGVHWVP